MKSQTSQEPSYYSITPANVRYDRNLTPNAKLLYGEITALCNKQGFCWATNNYFAELYNVSKTSVSKWISQLEQYGYIKTTLKYKKDTKEIEYRYIHIATPPIEEKLKTPPTKVKEGNEEKLNTPIEDNLKDNTTVFNSKVSNTFNNFDDEGEKKSNFLQYKNEIIKSRIYTESLCIKFKLKIDSVDKILDNFIVHLNLKSEKDHPKDLDRFKNYFLNWIIIQDRTGDLDEFKKPVPIPRVIDISQIR